MKKTCTLRLYGPISLAIKSPGLSWFPYRKLLRVNGVFSNPASIADSRYRFDVNIFSLSTLAANNQASFRLKNISSSFKGDSVKNQVFGKDAGPASGMLQLDIKGPSVMFNIGRNNSFAITTRARMFANIVDLDGKLFNKLTSDFNNDPSLPYNITSGQNMRVSVNAWSELGLSYGRVITHVGPHFLKGGITLKYLSGAGNGHINIDNFNGTIDKDILLQDVYLKNTTGRIATGFGGVNISGIQANDLLKMNSRGIGTDIGFVYEFRPNSSVVAGEGTSSKKDNSYKFKFGVAVIDLGSIRYKKDMLRSGAYDIGITGNERLSLQELNNVNLDDYNAFFSSRPQYFTPAGSNTNTEYNVSLPTTLQLDADYHIQKRLFVSLGSQLSLSNNKSKGYNNRAYSGVTITPRYESKKIGLYLPVNYNQLTKLNAGISIRVGPLFLGSGSILSSALGKSKQADLFFGFRFGGLK